MVVIFWGYFRGGKDIGEMKRLVNVEQSTGCAISESVETEPILKRRHINPKDDGIFGFERHTELVLLRVAWILIRRPRFLVFSF